MGIYNSYADRDPYEDFLRWDVEQDEEERGREREEARLDAYENSHEGRIE